MDIPRIFNITESAHRIHNPITPEKLATLGAALRLELPVERGRAKLLVLYLSIIFQKVSAFFAYSLFFSAKIMLIEELRLPWFG